MPEESLLLIQSACRLAEMEPSPRSCAGGIGDRAGFAHGMKVIGVNNKTFSRQRLLDALARVVNRHKIEFLLIEGEDFRTLVLEYSGGPRYLEIVRDPSKARPPGRDPQTGGGSHKA